MGSFRYCPHCERGHGKPTVRQDLIEWNRITCKCGNVLPQYMNEKEWIIDLSDQIEWLEKILGVVKN